MVATCLSVALARRRPSPLPRSSRTPKPLSPLHPRSGSGQGYQCIIHSGAFCPDGTIWASPPLPVSSLVRSPVGTTYSLAGVAFFFLDFDFFTLPSLDLASGCLSRCSSFGALLPQSIIGRNSGLDGLAPAARDPGRDASGQPREPRILSLIRLGS